MSRWKTTTEALAAAFLAGDFDVDQLVNRGTICLGRRWRWLRPLAGRVVAHFGCDARPRAVALTKFILADDGFCRAVARYGISITARRLPEQRMQPIAAAENWQVPAIGTPRELAEWLELPISQLDWLADRRLLCSAQRRDKLRHYRYRPLTKRFGQIRLIESPKPRLKQIQRRIHDEILTNIPVHVACHGFCRGRSITTFAAPHSGKQLVLKIDLRDFFPSIRAARVRGLYCAVGYPQPVADLLTGLCTTATPVDVWDEIAPSGSTNTTDQIARMYAIPHLPQGAPTSPSLANLCAYRLDCRLAALAASAGATYTRYADDLAFSGDEPFARRVARFQHHVCAAVMEEGFHVHHRKTRIMRCGVRQRLVGLTVNQHVNTPRDEYDRLKATLHNCVKFGIESQNREGHKDFRAHLAGRISFVEMVNPHKGSRLRRLFEQIAWE